MSSVPDLIALHDDESRLQVRRDALLASIGGQWKDTKGSVYDVSVDAWNSCTVATTRPTGAARSTRGLIRLHHDLVADVMSLRWNDAYVLQLGGGRLPTVAWWVPVGRGAAFHCTGSIVRTAAINAGGFTCECTIVLCSGYRCTTFSNLIVTTVTVVSDDVSQFAEYFGKTNIRICDSFHVVLATIPC